MRKMIGKWALLGAAVAFGLMTNTLFAQHEHETAADATSGPAVAKEPMQPIPSVLENYSRIEASLANDSLNGVPEASQAISKLVTGDDMKMLPPDVATQAEALAKAKDLAGAREAFKPLSASLIKNLKKDKVQTGRYYAAYCPMARASWLQTGKAIKNPYMGQEMLTCGQITGNF